MNKVFISILNTQPSIRLIFSKNDLNAKEKKSNHLLFLPETALSTGFSAGLSTATLSPIVYHIGY